MSTDTNAVGRLRLAVLSVATASALLTVTGCGSGNTPAPRGAPTHFFTLYGDPSSDNLKGRGICDQIDRLAVGETPFFTVLQQNDAGVAAAGSGVPAAKPSRSKSGHNYALILASQTILDSHGSPIRGNNGSANEAGAVRCDYKPASPARDRKAFFITVGESYPVMASEHFLMGNSYPYLTSGRGATTIVEPTGAFHVALSKGLEAVLSDFRYVPPTP